MLRHPCREGRDLANRGLTDALARPPVDCAGRQMKDEIDDAGGMRLVAQQLVERLGELGADAGEGGSRGEERIEDGGAQWLHGMSGVRGSRHSCR